MRHESMRYGYALVHTVRALAFLILVSAMAYSIYGLWNYTVTGEKAKGSAIDALNREEQSALAASAATYETEYAAAQRGLERELAGLRNQIVVMQKDVVRFDAGYTCNEALAGKLTYTGLPGRETIARALDETVELVLADKEVLTKVLSDNFNGMIAPLQQRMEEIKREAADKERELRALMDKYKPIRKEIRKPVVREVEDTTEVNTVYGVLPGDEVKARIRGIRTELPRLTELSAFSTEKSINCIVNIKETTTKLINWLPSTPPPHIVTEEEISYAYEDPQWSAEDALKRDLLSSSIARLAEESDKLEQQATELEQRKTGAVALVKNEWLIEGTISHARCQLDALVIAREKWEARDRKIAAEAKVARNLVRRAYIRGGLALMQNQVLSPLYALVGGWLAWLVLMILADFTACPLVTALRTQSLDEKYKQS